jgi:hypothetical protein
MRLATRLAGVERCRAEHRGQRNIGEHGQVRERPRNLIRPRDAGARDAMARPNPRCPGRRSGSIRRLRGNGR